MRAQRVFSHAKWGSYCAPALAGILCICALFLLGCNSIVPSSSASGNANSAIPQFALPTGTVGAPYSAALFGNVESSPFLFSVSEGQLPPGLSLNPTTGLVSGSPARAGQFAFTVSIGGKELRFSTTRTYELKVDPEVSHVAMSISPLDPTITPGGKIQFSATLKNTKNPGVTWSASNGVITSTGLYTAPTSASIKSVTITATSVAQPSVQASTKISLAYPQLQIGSVNIPSAKAGTSYNAKLVASGGQTPYSWTLLSGSLPSGFQFAPSSGAITGSTKQSGTFDLTFRVTDAVGQSTQKSFALVVSGASTSNCGPPTYNCSRTDMNIVQVPVPPPNVGNLTGANTIVTDPDFSNPIVRITDWNTDPGLVAANRSFVSAGGGSADENLWNLDSSLLVLQALGGWAYPFTFDSSTMQASRMYASSFSTNGGMRMPSGNWSRVDPNIFFAHEGTALYQYNFTDRVNPPSPQLVYDFTSSSNCLPRGFNATWRTQGGNSSGDTVFSMAYSNVGIQGTGTYVVAYKVGSGCTMLNTQTGQVTGDWGSQGTIGTSDRWTVHNVKMSKDGNWLVVVRENCLSSTCVHGPYFWQIGTTNIGWCGQGGHCSGHWTEGYTHWINNPQNAQYESRSFAQDTNVLQLTPGLAHGIPTMDQHASWNNVDPNDTLPFFLSTWDRDTTQLFPGPYYNEILGIAPDGSGKVWRFAHSFITGQSQEFTATYGIGTVSQDGRFFIFTSDWMGTLGSQSGNASCTIGVDCRADVFVLQLN
ncbi:MAG TPA: Ig domain-containing protein [Candidatus Sulfotelmatobacter sp.]|nr:Ig domain-containing protein [Candidatus Sulfotelmatobacter sp.]